MKTKILGLVIAVMLPAGTFGQTLPVNVQKTPGTNAITGNLVIPTGKTLSASGSGSISATGGTSPVFTTDITAPKIIYTGTVIELYGSGTPEGAVTAAVGSIYHRTDGGAGTAVYIKQTGSGNTGWAGVVPNGSAGGSTTQLQYNNAGSFGGITGATTNGTAVTFTSGNFIATSPKITTDISDTNGAAIIKLTATASAVNQVTIANAATGNNPTFSATGSDTDISFAITPKGAGWLGATRARLGASVSAPESFAPIFQISGADSLSAMFYDFSATAGSSPALYLRRGRGTAGSFSAIQSGDTVGVLSFAGAYSSGAFTNSAQIVSVASENWSGSAFGSYLKFENTLTGNNIAAERMRISAAGNILIGTTSDTGLTGAGGLKVGSTTASSSPTTGSVVVGGGLGVAGDTFVGGIVHSTATGTNVFEGDVRIQASSSTARSLHLYNAASNNEAIIKDSGTSGNSLLDLRPGDVSSITAAQTGAVRFPTYGAGTATFDSSGNITSVSDARAKDTISNFTTGLSAIRQLQPKKYHWKPETGLNTEDVNVAVYAQDLLAVGLPEAVATERTVQVKDASGRIITKRVPAERYTVSERAIISALINSVKELAAANDALSARVDTLEATAKNKAK